MTSSAKESNVRISILHDGLWSQDVPGSLSSSRNLAYHAAPSRQTEKILYASTTFADAAALRRWTSYVQHTLRNDFEGVTWEQVKQWLKNSIASPASRNFYAHQTLATLTQKNSQSFEDFLEQYEIVEAELPTPQSENNAVAAILTRLNPYLRQQIIKADYQLRDSTYWGGAPRQGYGG